MTKPLAVLIVEDSESDALLVVRLLSKADYKVDYEQVDSAEAMRTALAKQNWDIVISDYSLPQFDGMAALNLLREQRPDIPFIAVSGTMGEETAVAMMKAGAHDYLVKGNLARLVPAIDRELEQAVVRRERLQAEEELQASEERYRLIFDTSLDGILLTAQDGAILTANRSACLIFDRTEAELKQTQRSKILETSDPRFDEALEGRSQKGNYFGEVIMIRRDGTKIPGEVATARFKDKDGSLKTSMILRDITGRKRREEQLAESEGRYKRLFDNSGTSILIIDKNGKYLQANRRAAENFGKTVREVEGRSVLDLLPSKTAQKTLEVNQSLIRSGGHREYETTFELAGVQRTFLVIDQCVQDAWGQNYAIQSSAIDITERKQAEEALRESESIFRGFLEQSEDAIMLANEQGRVIQWSKGAEKLTGYARAESLGEFLWDVQFRSAPDELRTPDTHEAIKTSLQSILGTGQGPALNHLIDAVIQRPDGTRAAVQTLGFSIQTGKAFLLGSILRDITERKRAEEAIRLSEERYRTLYENNNLGLYRTTPAGEILLANPSLVKMLGFNSFDELRNKNLEQDWFQPSFPRSQFLELIEKHGQVQGLESAWERQDGSFIFVSESSKAIRDAEGRTLYYDGTVEDITERRQAEDKLRLSEKRFSGAFEYAAIGMALVATDGLMLRVNRALCELLGYQQEELLEKTFQDLTHPEDAETDQVYSSQLLAGKVQSYQIEKRLFHRSGEIVWVLLNESLIRDDRGEPLYLISQIENITQRKQAEEALHASEIRYKDLFEDSPMSLWEEDYSAVKQRLDALRAEGVTDFPEYIALHPDLLAECASLIKILDVNKATMRLFGADRKEEMLKGLAEIFEGQPPQAFQEELMTIAAGRTRLDWQGINKTLDGRLIDIEMSWSIAPGYEDNLSRVIVSLVDITERKQAEAALAKSEQDYRTLFENMPIGLYRTDAGGRILDANQAMVDMFGYRDREALLAENVVDLYVDRDSDRKFKDEIEKTGIVTNFEAEFRRPDGTTFWTEDHNHIVRAEDGTPLFYEGSLIDITERKQAEAALHESRQRYRALFEDTPLAIWEQDFSGLKKQLEALKQNGPGDLRQYFEAHPQAITECADLIRYLDVNKAALKLYGAGSKEDLFKNTVQVLSQGEQEHILEDILAIAQGRTGNSWEGADQTLAGDPIEISLNWSVAPGYEHDFSRVIVTTIDITERKQAEDMLMAERDLLTTLINTLPDSIFVKDVLGRVVLDNNAHQHTLGATSLEQVVGKTDFDFHPRENATQYDADEKRVIQSGVPMIDKIEPFVDKEKNHKWLLTTKVPLHDRQGNITGIVGFNHDITERKQSEERIQRHLQRLAALRAIDQVVTSSFDLHNSLTVILKHVTEELGVDAADVLMLNPVSIQLDYGGGVGFRTRAAEKASERLGNSYAGQVTLERQLISVADLKEQPSNLRLRPQLAGEDFTSYFGVPLMAKGSVKGVLEIFHRSRLEPDQEWFDFLNTVAGQAALAIDNTNLFDSLQRSNIDLTLAYDATIEGWSHAMDLRDKETEGHTLRVTEMTMELAGLFGIKDESMVGIRRGALLHDIGKMGVPDAILLKPAKLTDEEWLVMRKHPALAFEMLSPIRYLQSAIDIPYCHHEKWDGSGYPRGLKGEQIPLAARIFAIADVWDALTSDRPYRAAWSNDKTLEYLKSEAGKHFDPQVLKTCLEAGVFNRINRS